MTKAWPGERSDVSSVLRRHTLAAPDRPLLTFADTGETLTYGAFSERVNRFANSLANHGVGYGDYVNLMLSNSIEYLVASYALRRLGAVEVAVNSQVRGPALARMLQLAEARVWVVGAEFASPLADIADGLSPPDLLVAVGEPEALAAKLGLGGRVIGFADFQAKGSPVDPKIAVNPLDPALVIFTSGTTGPSKGCLLSHRKLIRSAEIVVEEMGQTPEDRIYTGYPLFHTRASQLDCFGTMLVGGHVILASRFSASRFWADLRRYDVTIFSIIGTVMQILWKQDPSPLDRQHNVRITWGGPITIAPEAFRERFGIEVLPGDGVYGMTETGMVSMSSRNPADSGKVRPNYDVMIADGDDEPLAPGEVGEILVRPREPGIMYLGYLSRPDATVAASRNLWFHTGDLGRLDAAGRLTFLGRKREMVRVGGHNVSCWEVEEILDSHPDVLESAVLGLPSGMGEEEIAAAVVFRPGAAVGEAGLRAYCEPRMAKFMIPSHIYFEDELPKTANGKIAKGDLLKLLTSRRTEEA